VKPTVLAIIFVITAICGKCRRTIQTGELQNHWKLFFRRFINRGLNGIKNSFTGVLLLLSTKNSITRLRFLNAVGIIGNKLTSLSLTCKNQLDLL
jgi:hypothetical protein